MSEGVRYVFADTEEGLAFDRGTYPALAEAETLDDVAAYIRETLEEDHSRQTEVLPPEGNLDTGEFVFVEKEAEEGP